LEVFEHVLPRVARAFDNSSGCIAKTQGNYVLTNVTREGSVQIFDHLVFHCERETTLETRVFAECDLLKHLAAAGLSEIEVHRKPVFRTWGLGARWPVHFRFQEESRRIALEKLERSVWLIQSSLTFRELPTGRVRLASLIRCMKSWHRISLRV